MPKKEMTCPYCGYKWIPRVENPKKCPYCQRWLRIPNEVKKHGKV